VTTGNKFQIWNEGQNTQWLAFGPWYSLINFGSLVEHHRTWRHLFVLS